MPRRRRPPCKMNPLAALQQKKSPDNSRRERDRERERDHDREYPHTQTHRQHHHSAAASGSVFNDTSPKTKEYKLFPELHNQTASLPTFADIFGQPLPILFNFPHEDMPTCSIKAGIECAMLHDNYGIADMLETIRNAHTNPNIALLSIGEDLSCFGLDLAAQGDIYVHFNGPFTQDPPQRSSMDCALELGMRGMRDAMIKYPSRPPIWESFVPETRNLGLIGLNTPWKSSFGSSYKPGSATYSAGPDSTSRYTSLATPSAYRPSFSGGTYRIKRDPPAPATSSPVTATYVSRYGKTEPKEAISSSDRSSPIKRYTGTTTSTLGKYGRSRDPSPVALEHTSRAKSRDPSPVIDNGRSKLGPSYRSNNASRNGYSSRFGSNSTRINGSSSANTTLDKSISYLTTTIARGNIRFGCGGYTSNITYTTGQHNSATYTSH
ncbi:uncharacterized protein Dwil_GK16737 [Drosophila willistoni]|uniref:Uncharacterized protein n=1 Tax=Drosophila willistoni TaxID=7260 RepID=A0A0Q9WQV0_DROWI|nr:uncharacterized protein Dwil_GK16737 [Drosophila willistoni]